MIKLKILCFTLLGLMLPMSGNCAEIDYVEMGKKGIEAFTKGDVVSAMGLLEKSADNGYAPAQATLAYILDAAEEDDAAFELYKKSALQMHPPGQYGLSLMYMKGEGVTVNQQVAGKWMRFSADAGHVPAMRAMALASEFGTLGLDRNLPMASEWFHRCHDAGDGVCTQRLSRAYGTGDLGFPVNMQKATELYDSINKNKEKY